MKYLGCFRASFGRLPRWQYWLLGANRETLFRMHCINASVRYSEPVHFKIEPLGNRLIGEIEVYRRSRHSIVVRLFPVPLWERAKSFEEHYYVLCTVCVCAIPASTASADCTSGAYPKLGASWLKEQVSTGQMRVLHEVGETQLADLATKPLPRQRPQELVALWRLKDSDRKVRTLTTETAQAQLAQLSATGLAGLVT